MGLYSRVVFPRLCDWVTNDPRMAALRSELLADVDGLVLGYVGHGVAVIRLATALTHRLRRVSHFPT